MTLGAPLTKPSILSSDEIYFGRLNSLSFLYILSKVKYMELLVILLFPAFAAIGTLANLVATLVGGIFELAFCLISSTGKGNDM